MRRGLVAVLIPALVVLCVGDPAGGEGVGGGSGDVNPWVYVVQPGDAVPGGPGPGDGDGGTGVVTCFLYEPVGDGSALMRVTEPVVGGIYLLWCRDGAGETVVFSIITYDPAVFFIDAAELAAEAYRELPLVYPDPQTSPDIWMDQLVAVPTWLWVSPSEWQTRSATASAGGLSATVTATPDRMIWTMGDGSKVVCHGPGVAYDPSLPDGAQSTYCSHTYRRSSAGQPEERFPVSVVLVWTVRWSATDGSGGALPEAWRGTQFSLRVAEAQAVRVTGGES